MEYKLLDELFSPAIIADEKGKIIYFNNATSIFCSKSPRLINKDGSVFELFKNIKDELEALFDRIQKSGNVEVSTEMQFEISGKQKTGVFKIVPIENKKITLFINDLTVEMELYQKYRLKLEELKASHAELIHADRLRALGELTTGISHEINNPLTVAIGNTELLQFAIEDGTYKSDPQNLVLCQKNIQESLDRIQNIIKGMRDFSYKDESKKEYVRLKDIVDNAIALVKASFENENVKLVFDCKDETLLGLVDKTKSEQILVNLLNNALYELKSISNPKVQVSLGMNPVTGNSDIIVEDNGKGIDPSIREELFKPFITTKMQGEGTGLGLSLSRKMAEGMQGELTLEDSKVGAKFKFSLPSLEISSLADNELLYSPEGSLEDSKRILVVDNEVSILNVCAGFLSKTNYLFIGSSAGHKALDLLENYPVDLIVVDIVMPEMDGRELAKKIRQKGYTIPIIYMSALNKTDIFNTDKSKLGIAGYVVKPFSQQEFISILEGVLKK